MPLLPQAPDATLATLRAAVARIERGGTEAARHGVVPIGLAEIDNALPGGGLAAGAVHEVTGSAAGGFAAMLAGRFAGPVLWCVMEHSRSELYGPGLAAFGLDTRRLVVARCPSRRDMLWAMEEGLRDPVLAAVLGEPDRAIALTASRRLQLAAETGGVTGLVLRRGAENGALSPSAVFSRWRADSLPAPLKDRRATTRALVEGARWRLELLRCRGGFGEMHGTWTVDWCDATRDLSLVSGSRHRPVAAGTAERLAG